MALVVGTLLALLNANRLVYVLHFARLLPVAKKSAPWRFLNEAHKLRVQKGRRIVDL